MKYILITVALFLMISVNGQVVTRKVSSGVTLSKHSQKVKEIKSVKMPKLKTDTIKKNKDKTKPLKFGHITEVNLNLNNSGNWTETDNGRIWTLNIISEGSKSINLVFDKFYIPEGGEFYLYNLDETVLMGPITSKHNTKNGKFATDLIEGESIILEYFEPEETESEISISKVVQSKTLDCIGFGCACDFQIDINCPQGDDWQDESNSVCLIIYEDSERGTGTLISNTSYDFTPYVLTANHVLDDRYWDTDNFLFRFGYKSPTCGGVDDYIYHTFYGATIKINTDINDLAFLELNNDIPSNLGITLSGWDRSEQNANSVTCIHHPMGDVMKISSDYDEPINSTRSWIGPHFDIDEGNAWQVEWNEGVTEIGSSGSALFNQNHRIVGHLHGGYSDCDVLDGDDYFPKFNISWEQGLSEFLDPGNTGAMTTNTIECKATISGPSTVCTSGATFTLNDRPPGTTVNWIPSNNLYPLSVNGTDTFIVEPTSSTLKEWGWVKAEISIESSETVTVSKNVWLGKPAAQILGLTELAKYSSATYTAGHYYNCPIDSYLWRISSPLYAFSYFPNTNQSYEIETRGNYGTFYLYLTTSNNCGSQRLMKNIVVTDDGGGSVPRSPEVPLITVYPNPANTNIEVNIQDEKLSSDKNLVFKTTLFNSQSIPVYKNNFKNNVFTIDVSGFSSGIYLLQVICNQEVYNTQILIEK
ncbi:MAG: trypsin-like peptidase domain-containing protein [Bacteroidales bacterium]|nr:trypsin-like peptidase domain-containing protein [Bacteroidales bacterium]